MTITLTREEAQQVLDALSKGIRRNDWKIVCDAHNEMKMRLAQPKPEYRDVVIAGDLWRIEFLPDHAASVVLVRANYEAQPEPEPVASAESWFALVMCAAAEIEDASYGLRDEEAKRKAISGAKHYRDAANALYIAPPQREWQSLTDEEITVAWNEAPRIQLWVNAFARAIEAKLKEKNA